MKANVAEMWTEALRSGKYYQGRGALVTENGEHCCLGVLCDIAVREGVVDFDEVGRTFDGVDAELPESVMEWAGMDYPEGVFSGPDGNLVSLNDDYLLNFDEIARVIEEFREEL